jgi:hypothetical protein
MNVEHAPTAMTESRERHSSARLHGRWLLLARGIWITLVVLTVAIVFASLPVYIAQLQTPCAGSACGFQQLTPEQAETLKGIGLFPDVYTAFTLALTLATISILTLTHFCGAGEGGKSLDVLLIDDRTDIP